MARLVLGQWSRIGKGRYCWATCSPIPGCTDSEDAEAKVALIGIKLLDKVSVELDCANLTKALCSDKKRTDLSSVTLLTT
jgi:hypothetical protein